MPAPRIVEAVDIIADGVHSGILGRSTTPEQHLLPQGAEEALYDRIIPAIALPAHAATHAAGVQGRPMDTARILGEFKWSSQHPTVR